jgi:hypothetical protein
MIATVSRYARMIHLICFVMVYANADANAVPWVTGATVFLRSGRGVLTAGPCLHTLRRTTTCS